MTQRKFIKQSARLDKPVQSLVSRLDEHGWVSFGNASEAPQSRSSNSGDHLLVALLSPNELKLKA